MLYNASYTLKIKYRIVFLIVKISNFSVQKIFIKISFNADQDIIINWSANVCVEAITRQLSIFICTSFQLVIIFLLINNTFHRFILSTYHLNSPYLVHY